MMDVLPDGWRERYATFLSASQTKEAITRHDAKAFFSTYPRLVADSSPWAPLRKPLSRSVVGLVSSGGLHLPGQHPFDVNNIQGDASVRHVPTQSLDDWRISHGHYDEAAAIRDYNVVFPVDRLLELADEKVVGSIAPTSYSFDGYCTDAGRLLDDAGQAILEGMRREAVDAAILVPV